MVDSASALTKIQRALIICCLFTVVEFIGGLVAGSLAIMTDAAHMFCDSSGFLLSWIAITMALRAPTDTFTLGFQQVEALGALMSMVLVWFAIVFIISEGISRLYAIPEIKGGTMLWMATLGLVLNLVLLATLGHEHHGHGGHSHGPGEDTTAPRTNCNRLISDEMLNAVRIKKKQSDQEERQHLASEESPPGFTASTTTPHSHSSGSHAIELSEQFLKIDLPIGIRQRLSNQSGDACCNHEHHNDGECAGKDHHCCSHTHEHAHDHDHGKAQDHNHSHEHGPGCSHDQKHAHDHGTGSHDHSHTHDKHDKCSSSNSQNQDLAHDICTHDHNHLHSNLHGHTCTHSHGNLALSAAVIHVIGDILQSIGVIIAALFIWWQPFDVGTVISTSGVEVSRWNYMDPICSMVFGGLVMYSTWHTTKKSVQMLILRTPEDLKVPRIRRALLDIEDVQDVRDIGCYVLGSNQIVISASLIVQHAPDSKHVIIAATRILAQLGATKTTVQVVDPAFYHFIRSEEKCAV